jgi:Zn-dependent M32 family carboxypeptidase
MVGIVSRPIYVDGRRPASKHLPVGGEEPKSYRKAKTGPWMKGPNSPEEIEHFLTAAQEAARENEALRAENAELKEQVEDRGALLKKCRDEIVEHREKLELAEEALKEMPDPQSIEATLLGLLDVQQARIRIGHTREKKTGQVLDRINHATANTIAAAGLLGVTKAIKHLLKRQ